MKVTPPQPPFEPGDRPPNKSVKPKPHQPEPRQHGLSKFEIGFIQRMYEKGDSLETIAARFRRSPAIIKEIVS